MKATLKQADLKDALAAVGRAAGASSDFAYGNAVLLRASFAGELELTATNTQISIRQRIPAQVAEEGAIAAPARRFTDLIGTLGVGPVELDCPDGSTHILVRQGRTNSRVEATAADSMPAFPSYSESPLLTMSAGMLRDAFAAVAFAAADKKDMRPVMTGVYFDFEEADKLAIVALDGYNLAACWLDRAEVPAPQDAPKDVIVPATSVAEMAKLMPKDSTCSVHLNERGQVAFVWPGSEFVAQRVEGQYVPWRRVLDQQAQTTCDLPAERLREFIRRAMVFCEERAVPAARLEVVLETSMLRFTTKLAGAGENVDECEVANATGAPIAKRINLRHLSAFTEAVDAESYTFSTRDGGSMIFRAPVHAGYFYLTQPMIESSVG